MEFSDLFYFIVIPALTAIVAGFAVNYYARMREATRLRAAEERIQQQNVVIEELQEDLEQQRRLADGRARLLHEKQGERLVTLAKISQSLDLGEFVGLECKIPGIPRDLEESFRQILEEVERLRSLEIPISPELAFHLAMVLHAQGKWDKAVGFLEGALQADSVNENARLSLGNLHLKRKCFSDAEEQFRALIELSGHIYEAHFGLGVSLLRQGKHEEGIQALTTAIRFRPESVEVYCELGRAYLEAGEPRRALETAQVVLKLDPDSEEGHLLYQEVLIKSGDFEEAISSCRRRLASGESAKILYNLAVAYSLSEDADGALEALRRAVTLSADLRYAAKDNPAFAPLHGSKRFRDLLAGKPGLF